MVYVLRSPQASLQLSAAQEHHPAPTQMGEGGSPRIGTPIMYDLEPVASNSISSLNTTSTLTLNSSPCPIHLAPLGSPQHPAQMNPAASNSVG